MKIFIAALLLLISSHGIVCQSDVSKTEQSDSKDKNNNTGQVDGIFTDVESEPGLILPAIQGISGLVKANPDEGGSFTGSRLMDQLQRLAERLTSMESLQVQTLLKLEGLDYRLTRVEVQMQERGETLRDIVTDASRRLQNLEGEVGRIETLLDVVHDESTQIRSAQSEIKILIGNVQSNAYSPPHRANEDFPASRPHALLAGMNTLRAVTNGLRDDLTVLHKNITVLTNLTRNVEKMSGELASKQDLNRMILLKNDGIAPAHSIPHSGQTCGTTNSLGRISLPRDCNEAQAMGGRVSGIQQIQPTLSSIPFFVQCDMETRGGGWTVIQQRLDGNINFLRGWMDYKHGFGNLATEFWLGLEKIHMLTNQGVYELLIEVTDFALNTATAHYSAFAIGSEVEGYDLRLLGIYDGDAGDSLSYHTSMKFSTPDMDQDQWPDGNCARDHTGGWWYRGCDTSNLNGQYLNGNVPPEFEYKGMYWYDYQGPMYSLLKSKIMIRLLPLNGTTITPRFQEPSENHNKPANVPKNSEKGQKGKRKKDSE